MATPLHARPRSPPHRLLHFVHLDLKQQKLGHKPQETRSPWSHEGEVVEEASGESGEDQVL